MEKFKNSKLVIVFLALTIAFCLPAVFAEAKDSELSGETHRSAVGAFVQNLRNVADKEQGEIGDKVREIANAQDNSKDETANEIDNVKNRSGLKTFLIGTDYKNIGKLRSGIATIGNQIDKLTELLGQTTDAADKATIQAQIDALKLQQNKINDFIKTNESKFSLFGWFVKFFNR